MEQILVPIALPPHPISNRVVRKSLLPGCKQIENKTYVLMNFKQLIDETFLNQ